MEIPADLAAVIKDWPNIRADLEFLRQLRKLEILTNAGTVRVELSPDAENAILDLRQMLDRAVEKALETL